MCGIVCTIQDITSSLYDLNPPCLCHHTHYIWHRVHCICVITSTVLMISHQLYFWDLIHYNSRHHIHCILRDRHSMTSEPLHSWHQIPYIWHHLQVSLHITSPPGFTSSRPLYLWHHRHYVCKYMSTIFIIKHTVQRQYNHYIWNHNLPMFICVITHTVSMI